MKESLVLVLTEREAKSLLNLLDGEAYWGELPETLEPVLKALRWALKDRRKARPNPPSPLGQVRPTG